MNTWNDKIVSRPTIFGNSGLHKLEICLERYFICAEILEELKLKISSVKPIKYQAADPKIFWRKSAG